VPNSTIRYRTRQDPTLPHKTVRCVTIPNAALQDSTIQHVTSSDFNLVKEFLTLHDVTPQNLTKHHRTVLCPTELDHATQRAAIHHTTLRRFITQVRQPATSPCNTTRRTALLYKTPPYSALQYLTEPNIRPYHVQM